MSQEHHRVLSGLAKRVTAQVQRDEVSLEKTQLLSTLPSDLVSSLWFGRKGEEDLCVTDEDTEAQGDSMPCPRSLHIQPVQGARNFATAVCNTDGFWGCGPGV